MEVSAALLLFYREKLNVSVSPSCGVSPRFPPMGCTAWLTHHVPLQAMLGLLIPACPPPEA